MGWGGMGCAGNSMSERLHCNNIVVDSIEQFQSKLNPWRLSHNNNSNDDDDDDDAASQEGFHSHFAGQRFAITRHHRKLISELAKSVSDMTHFGVEWDLKPELNQLINLSINQPASQPPETVASCTLIYSILFISLLAQIKIRTIISTDTNDTEIVLIGQKGSVSTYRCPQ